MLFRSRIEKDSLGEVKVPSNALYSAQTQRAIDNFPISFQPLPSVLIQAIASVKHASATTNEQLGKLSAEQANAIRQAAQEIMDGQWLDQFPIDVFQTGSGTSSNMNVNEVIATRASQLSGLSIHPNDHVNMAQSSNDTFPSAIHIACVQQIHQALFPALAHLQSTIEAKAVDCQDVVKTGRTHLMDAMPVRMGQELSGWAQQIANNRQRIENTLPQLCALAQGGTAVGTGVNAHAEFGTRFAQNVSQLLALPFTKIGRAHV